MFTVKIKLREEEIINSLVSKSPWLTYLLLSLIGAYADLDIRFISESNEEPKIKKENKRQIIGNRVRSFTKGKRTLRAGSRRGRKGL